MNTLRSSGFNTVILWTIHVYYPSGDLIFNDQKVCSGGAYVGTNVWPAQLATLKQAPTSVDRLEVCVGSGGVNDFSAVQQLIASQGTGTNSILCRNFQALIAATGADAVCFNDEMLFDAATMVTFGQMLAELGVKVTLCPYNNPAVWQSVQSQLGATVDAVYLQCYAGGAGNNPATWNGYFGGLKVDPGLWCKHGTGCSSGDSASSVATKMTNWITAAGITGGWMWLFDDMLTCTADTSAQYAAAIVGSAYSPAPVATWDGGGADNKWSTSTNWTSDVAPGADAELHFAGAARLTPSNDFLAGTAIGNIQFDSGAGAFELAGHRISLAGAITNVSGTIQTINLDLDLTAALAAYTASNSPLGIGGDIGGGYGLTKSGTGTLTLGGSNSYSGATVLNGGTLAIGAAVNLGQTSLLDVYVGSRLLATTDGITLNQDNVSHSGGGAHIQIDAGTLTMNGNWSGDGSVYKDDDGTLVLNGAYGNSGRPVINAGTLRLGPAGSMATPNMTLNGGTFDLNGHDVALSQGLLLTSGSIVGPGTLTVVSLADVLNGAISASLAGTAALTKRSANTVVLSGSNIYSGATIISNGTLRIDTPASASGTGTNTLTVKAGTLSGGGRVGGAVTVADTNLAMLYPNSGNPLTLGGNLTLGANSKVQFDLTSTTASGNDQVVLQNKTLACGRAQITIHSAGALSSVDYVLFDVGAAGSISGSFNATPAWSGTTPPYAAGYSIATVGKTVVLRYVANSANRIWDGGGGNDVWQTAANWDGDISAPMPNDVLFFAGSIRMDAFNNFPDDTAFNALNFTGDAGAFTLSGNGIRLGAGGITNRSTIPQAIRIDLVLTSAIGIDVTNNGALRLDGAISGEFGVTKTGAGTLTLNGSNVYAGATTIGGGTLALSGAGSIGSSPGIAVASGATFAVSGLGGPFELGSAQMLSGAGTVVGDLTIAGTIDPGTGIVPAILTAQGGVSFHPGSTCKVDVNATTNDSLLASGNVDLGGATLAIAGTLAAEAYVVVSADGALSGTFDGLPNGAPIPFTGYSIHYLTNDSPARVVLSKTVSPIKYVIHVSVDGMHADAPRTLVGKGVGPNFARLFAEAAYTEKARTDYDSTVTSPNHATMLTGRPVNSWPGKPGHLWGNNDTHPWDRWGISLHVPHLMGLTYGPGPGIYSNYPVAQIYADTGPSKTSYEYISSVLDVVHDSGRRTCMVYGKDRLLEEQMSYGPVHGRLAPNFATNDPGVNKVDFGIYAGEFGTVSNWMPQMVSNLYHYSFLHFSLPDTLGHSYSWSFTNTWHAPDWVDSWLPDQGRYRPASYMGAITKVDGWLGEIFSLIETNAELNGKTAIVLTSDHGGKLGEFDHGFITDPGCFGIVVFAWGPGIPAGADLYALNPQYTNPGPSNRPDYNAMQQPIRDGDTPNLALSLLGLGPIPGSSMNSAQRFGAVDSDGDGLSDNYEWSILTDPAQKDTDGDRLSDGDELHAGTDPTDKASLLWIKEMSVDSFGTNTVVRWPSVSNRQYTVWGCTNMLIGAFAPIASNLPASPPLNSYTGAIAGAEMMIYGISVHP